MKLESSDLLLGDVCADDAFRAATLRQTLVLARRRRHVRIARRTISVALLLGVIAFLAQPPVAAPKLAARPSPVSIVRTVPLAPRQIVHTRTALFASVSSSPAGLTTIASTPLRYLVIETRTAAPRLDLLSDHQLLAAFADQRPALIAAGTEEARLAFH